LQTTSNDDEWSANDVLTHLRVRRRLGWLHHGAPRRGTADVRAVNPRTWITQMDYHELEFQPSLCVFAAQRAALLAILEPLPRDGWSRAATVTGAGKTLERTVLFYARWLAEQERPHIEQVTLLAAMMPMEQQPPRAST
jgi:hypothetical protein